MFSTLFQVRLSRRVLALCALMLFMLMAGVARGADAPTSACVRKSPRDPRYFELSDGRPYIPIGFNLVGAPAEKDFESILDTMAANKVNYCRVWLDQRPWQVERRAVGVYDEAAAKVLRRFLDLALARGIRVKLCTEYFRNILPERKLWSDNLIYHKANGGPFESMPDFLTSAAGQALYRRKLAFYQAQIGDHPAVFAWELWNEMNAVRGEWPQWTALMLPELHRLFPKNLCVQSLGSFDRNNARDAYRKLLALPDNDVAQVHRYLDQGAALEICHGPVDLLAVDAVRELLAMNPGRPVILAETGAVKPSHSGVSDLYARDKDGTLLHDMLFAPFFAGAAGTGDPWWWEQSIRRPNLWHHFARFAHAVEGIDPAAEHFEPLTVPHERLRVLALQGRTTLLAWCRDSKNDWRAELERGESPEQLAGLKLDLGGQLGGMKVGAAKIYSPWTDQWSELEIKNGIATLPAFQRSLVIKISY